MDASDIGVDLWALVHHLYAKNSINAFKELCLRTGVIEEGDNAFLESVPLSKLKETEWYKKVRDAFEKKQSVIKVQYRDRFEEVEEMTRMLYPQGCSLSEYAEAVQGCIGMLTFTISSNVVSSFLTRKDEESNQRTSYTVSGDELVADMTSLVSESVLPRMWWSSDKKAGEAASIVTKRVGLRCHPPEILVEYEVKRSSGSSTLRCRRIHLPPAILAPNHPVSSVARKLTHSHGMLLSDTEFQRLILDLQRLEQRLVDEKRASPPPPNPAETPSKSETKPRSSPAISQTPQEADLCLLYRDPDAALVNVDLNHADDDTVKEFKNVMDIKFNENVLKPGDPGYVYDRRVAVKPVTKSEWDSSDDDDDDD